MLSDMLSGQDIKNWFKKQRFGEPIIDTYQNLPELNNSNRCYFILYEARPRIGHWTICFYDSSMDIWEFFDPYGILIDDQLDFSFYKNMDRILTKKFLNLNQSHYEINDLRFQKHKPNINTCGKWCCIRYWFYKMGYTKSYFDDIFYYGSQADNRDKKMNALFNELNSKYTPPI